MTSTSAPRRSRRTAVAIALGTLLLGLAACGGSGDDPARPAPTTSPFSPYVALGDSYTAVSGTDTEIGDACLRSDDSYPNLLADKLGIDDVTNVSCGGATTGNLTSTQYPLGKGRNEPQLDALSADTKLVTLGIGLNDEGYGTLTLVSCFLVNGREQSSCAPYLARPQSDLDELVAQIGRNVAGALEKIKQAAPNARVVLVGYPRTLPDDSSCKSEVPLPKAALERVRTSGKDVNTTLKRVAAKADVSFLDMYAASTGHDVCSKDPWVNGQRTLVGQAYPFHPFPAYHVAVADELAALLEK